MDVLGLRLVRSLLNAKDLNELHETGFRPEDIRGEAKEAFEWVLSYVADYVDWPTSVMVEEATSVTLAEEAEPLPYVADLVRKRTLGLGLERDLKHAAELLEARKPDDAFRVVAELGTKHLGRTDIAKVISFRESTKTRFEEYERLKFGGGYEGITTRWDKLNEAIQAWVNGTFNVITAMQNTGKTWFAIINAEHSLRLGKKVLFVTLEMPSVRIQRRLEAVKYKLSFGELRDAELDMIAADRYRDGLIEDRTGDGDVLFADKKMVRYVSDVSALVTSHKPDIVFIDGGYRFQSKARGAGSWESTVTVVNELQLAAEVSGIPWVVTTQQGDSSETGRAVTRGPKMRAWNVRYGKEWVINPDNVIGLYQDSDLRLVKMMEIHTLKVRDIGDGKLAEMFRIKWNTGEMLFDEIAGGHEEFGEVEEGGKIGVDF